jgi:hypothetical protein
MLCKKCGKKMWTLVNWNAIKDLTLEQVKQQLICSDCIVKEAEHEQNRA